MMCYVGEFGWVWGFSVGWCNIVFRLCGLCYNGCALWWWVYCSCVCAVGLMLVLVDSCCSLV